MRLAVRQVDPARGRLRQYAIAQCRSLFGEPAIFVTWGRIGAATRTRLETFASPQARAKRWGELVARRRAHGYRGP